MRCLPNPQILYIDDDKDSREMLAALLTAENPLLQISVAGSAAGMYDLLKDQTFNLYILDYALPEISGIEICQRIRQSDKRTPILFFSAMARETDRPAGRRRRGRRLSRQTE